MRPDVAETLIRHNREFYAAAGSDFAQTRMQIQPGMARALDSIDSSASVLDVGCANARLAGELARRHHAGGYVGVDQDLALLDLARRGDLPEHAAFVRADITRPGWHEAIDAAFDLVAAFAVVQHVPTFAARLTLMSDLRALSVAGGLVAFSTWNLSSSDRMRDRIVDWSSIGLSDADVDAGDQLVEWRRGTVATRYVHEFDPSEIEALRTQAGFERVDAFDADGANSRLGHYEIWRPAP